MARSMAIAVVVAVAVAVAVTSDAFLLAVTVMVVVVSGGEDSVHSMHAPQMHWRLNTAAEHTHHRHTWRPLRVKGVAGFGHSFDVVYHGTVDLQRTLRILYLQKWI